MVPWSVYWQRNYFVYAWPGLWEYLDDDFIRGAVSGLGFLNLFAAFAELAPVFSADRRSVPVLSDRETDTTYAPGDTQVEP
ncbi:MAG: hypothetical protein AB7F99_01620 [Vicinamibacterales bacterium]